MPEKEEIKDLTRLDGAEVAKKKEKLLRIKQYREDKDTKEVLALPAGKRLFYKLLEQCGASRTPHFAGDPYATHVNIGRQQIGLWLISEIERAAPMAYSEMIRQHQSDVVFEDKLNKEAEQELERT